MPEQTNAPSFRMTFKRPLLAGLASAVLVALLSLLIPNRYRSEAHLLPLESRTSGSLGQLGAAAAALGMSLPGGEADGPFLEVLTSRWMKEELARTEFSYGMRRSPLCGMKERRGTLQAYVGAPNMDRTVKKLDRIFSASRDAKTKVITITAETRSPELSREVVQRAMDLLETFSQTRGRTRGGYKAAFAEARLQDFQKDLDQAEAAFKAFLVRNRNYPATPDPSLRLEGARLEMQLKVKQQLAATLVVNRENALLEEKNDMPILNVLDRPNLPEDKTSPPRMVFATLAFLIGALGTLLWPNLGWIKARIKASAALATQP
jgi:hypothetical protein